MLDAVQIYKLKGICDEPGEYLVNYDTDYTYDEALMRFTGISGSSFIAYNVSSKIWELLSSDKRVIGRVAHYDSLTLLPFGKNKWNLTFDCDGDLDKPVLKYLKLTKVNDNFLKLKLLLEHKAT